MGGVRPHSNVHWKPSSSVALPKLGFRSTLAHVAGPGFDGKNLGQKNQLCSSLTKKNNATAKRLRCLSGLRHRLLLRCGCRTNKCPARQPCGGFQHLSCWLVRHVRVVPNLIDDLIELNRVIGEAGGFFRLCALTFAPAFTKSRSFFSTSKVICLALSSKTKTPYDPPPGVVICLFRPSARSSAPRS